MEIDIVYVFVRPSLTLDCQVIAIGSSRSLSGGEISCTFLSDGVIDRRYKDRSYMH